MGPYRNTAAIQAEDVLKVKPNRHNMHRYISKNINVIHTSQCSISYYHHKPNDNAIVAAVGTLLYMRPSYNITQLATISNYTNIQQSLQFSYHINAAKKAGFIDELKDYYTKCRLVTVFQIKGNYLLLNEIDIMYFSVYYRALVYEESSMKEALNVEMNELLSLIEMDGREVIVRLCEPYQLVRNDTLLYKIKSEYEINSYEINPDNDAIKESISKVSEWLMNLENEQLRKFVDFIQEHNQNLKFWLKKIAGSSVFRQRVRNENLELKNSTFRQI
ncbi:hypothetical protein GLOIN_2v964220 [Rhizophagus clarus]|uniref:Uncharacterized protein n=1 Tax=Rhizophagus clarus TaxID=94130 RepID=A0A8H3LX97_9GLOM|nr:hypothetical protein GLOIN_2v964220 [Rhizophagus clarus]